VYVCMYVCVSVCMYKCMYVCVDVDMRRKHVFELAIVCMYVCALNKLVKWSKKSHRPGALITDPGDSQCDRPSNRATPFDDLNSNSPSEQIEDL
jgi:hypothetical protein